MRPVVLDASVAVKWFRDEPGTTEARQLLEAHADGDLVIVVPSLLVYEFIGVASRYLSPAETQELWRRFVGWRIHVREVGDSLMRGALEIQERHGCALYDAISPSLAAELEAPLYSADRRAHGSWPGVVFVG